LHHDALIGYYLTDGLTDDDALTNLSAHIEQHSVMNERERAW